MSVAPLAGARIEIPSAIRRRPYYLVAPLAGARIEIMALEENSRRSTASLPSRERGLKYAETFQLDCPRPVAPLAGARIEIGQD